MKKKRLALLLTALLSISCFIGGCSAVSDVMHEHFDSSVDKYTTYTSVKRYDGDLYGSDTEKNIIILKTEETDATGNKKVILDVVDAITGVSVVSQEENFNSSNPYREGSFEVSIDKYPLITFSRETLVDSSTNEYKTYYTHYLVKQNGVETIDGDYNSEKDVQKYAKYEGGLITFTLEETTYWVDKNGEIVRTFDKFVTEGYGVPTTFNAEFNGYLYSWDFDPENTVLGNKIQVFNKDGVCSVQYVVPNGTYEMGAYLLNNGNIFVQELQMVLGAGEDYDFLYPFTEYMSMKVKVSSKIINYQSGEVTELDLDFIVGEISTYYQEQEFGTDFSFALKEGQQNQAMIVNFDKTGIASKYRYVVLDNLMNVKFEVINESVAYKESAWLENLEWFGDDYYLIDGDDGKVYVCDFIGQIKLEVEGAYYVGHTDEYLVTENAILDIKGEVKYDFKDFAGNEGFEVEVEGNKIYAWKTNYVTGCDDLYEIKEEKGKLVPVLFSAGIDERVSFIDDGLYRVFDREFGTYAFYNEEGTLLLKMNEDEYKGIRFLSDCVIIEGLVNGDSVCYVLK